MMNLRDTETADNSKYRLIGRSVLSYRFIAPHSETLYIGDIKKVVDKTKGSTFFAKITDLSHDSNFADPKWDTRAYAEQFYGLGEDVFITVDAVPLGFVDADGKFHKPRTIPSKFSSVEDPTADDFMFLTRQMGEIEVGLMRSGQDVIKDVAVRIPSNVLPQHMGVFATTGMGKSNFMKTFCASCMKEQKFGLLIVDPHGEYVNGGKSSTGDPTKGLVHYTNGRDGLAIFTIRGEADRKKYAMNRLWLEYDDFRASDLSILHDLSAPQYDIVEALGRAPQCGTPVRDIGQCTRCRGVRRGALARAEVCTDPFRDHVLAGEIGDVGRHVVAVVGDAARHVPQQHQCLCPLVGLDLQHLQAGLQSDQTEQADRKDDHGDQHFDQCESTLAVHGSVTHDYHLLAGNFSPALVSVRSPSVAWLPWGAAALIRRGSRPRATVES